MSNTSQGLDVGKMALEGFGQVMGSMDLLQRAWSTFSLPTPFTPTLNVEELDKRIADLRAVEQWLSLNQNMLRSTIQGLESPARHAQCDQHHVGFVRPGHEAGRRCDGPVARPLCRSGRAEGDRPTPSPKRRCGARRRRRIRSTGRLSRCPRRSSTGRPARRALPRSERGADGATGDFRADEPGTDRSSNAAAAEHGRAASDAPLRRRSAINPLAWWNLLQDNFRQIAQAATRPAYAASNTAARPPSKAPSARLRRKGRDRRRRAKTASVDSGGASRPRTRPNDRRLRSRARSARRRAAPAGPPASPHAAKHATPGSSDEFALSLRTCHASAMADVHRTRPCPGGGAGERPHTTAAAAISASSTSARRWRSSPARS